MKTKSVSVSVFASLLLLSACGGPELASELSETKSDLRAVAVAVVADTTATEVEAEICLTDAQTDQSQSAYCAQGLATDPSWNADDREGCGQGSAPTPAEFEGLVAQIESEEGRSLDSAQVFEEIATRLALQAPTITAAACRAACTTIFPNGGARQKACLAVCKALKNTTCCGLRWLCAHYQRRGHAGLRFYEACIELYAVLCTNADVIDD